MDRLFLIFTIASTILVTIFPNRLGTKSLFNLDTNSATFYDSGILEWKKREERLIGVKKAKSLKKKDPRGGAVS